MDLEEAKHRIMDYIEQHRPYEFQPMFLWALSVLNIADFNDYTLADALAELLKEGRVEVLVIVKPDGKEGKETRIDIAHIPLLWNCDFSIRRVYGKPQSGIKQATQEGTWERKRSPVQPAAGAPNKKRFQIALSFAGEYRQYVSAVASLLVAQVGRHEVFYDENFKAELARPQLDAYLQDIYHKQSELLVVFLGGDYAKKQWCGVEWRVISDLIKNRQYHAIMFIRMDDGEVPGVFSTDGYVDARTHTPKQLAGLILERLEVNQRQPKQDAKNA